ncbi:MAG: hypothetical protein AAFO04_06510 [Cyanobacteria bacterium J06592_8]
MVQSASNLLTVDEFILQYGDRDRYELIDGELIDMEPTGTHEQVAAFIGRKLNVEIDRQIGKPKQPTVTICRLVGDEYQKQLLQNNNRLISSIFPELQLTAGKLFTAADCT